MTNKSKGERSGQHDDNRLAVTTVQALQHFLETGTFKSDKSDDVKIHFTL